MLEMNALNEYSDVDLVGGSAFPKKDICQVIEDSLIQNVVGKLNHAVVWEDDVVFTITICVCILWIEID